MKGWHKRTGSNIIEGYGLSETCAASHINPLAPRQDRLVRLPDPEHAGRGDEPRDAASSCRRARPASWCCRGPNVMRGYWNKPEESAQVFIERDGMRWLRTGDIVRMDEEGYFHFYDRSKDLIKYKGHSIFAKDVEDVLYGHPQVKAAGVIGVADPAVGQRIKAIVVLQGDARGKVSEDEIKAYCKRAAGRVQGAAHRRVPRRAAEDRRRQGLAPRAARRDRAPRRHGRAVLPGRAPHQALRRADCGEQRRLRARSATRSSA